MARSRIEKVDRDIWDRIGMSLSGICVIHCLALPVLVSLMPLWTAASVLHDWLHPIFAVLLIPTTILAGLAGYRRHRRLSVPVLLAMGLGIIVVAAIVFHEEWGSVREIAFTTVGSIVLIAGHLLNWRYRQCRV